MSGYHINKTYAALMPHNCPVLEYTADGQLVGTCAFYIDPEKGCERHGFAYKPEEEKAK